MSEIVFVLGAGASKHCGTPLMDDFLTVARGLYKSGEVDEEKDAFADVMDAIGKLNAVASKVYLPLNNIETVYTAFEMGRLLGKLPGIDNEQRIDGLLPAIRKVIGLTLERTTRIRDETRETPFPAYSRLASIFEALIGAARKFSVISFNYDLGLDYSLYKNEVLVDYSLGDKKVAQGSVTYLKLHGSLNFGKCRGPDCGKVNPYRQFGTTQTLPGSGYSILPVMSKLKTLKCAACGERLQDDPLMVPPTWDKTAHYQQIQQIWRRAAAEMKDAERVFVLGYSLPDTDWFFKYLYGLGVEMQTPIEGFYVYNTDPEAQSRFEAMIGESVRGAQRFHFYNMAFEHAVEMTPPGEAGFGLRTIPQILDIKPQTSSSWRTSTSRR